MTKVDDGMMPDPETIEKDAKSKKDVANLIRSSAGDALTAMPGIEEMIIGLTKTLHTKVLAFVLEDIEFFFSGMRMFDGIPDAEVENILKIRVNGDENSRVAAILVEPDPVRHILAILFGGQKASVTDFGEGPLRPSEASLFLLFSDELITGLVEAIDIVGTHGIPGAPAVSTKKEFRQFCHECEFVALAFSIGFEDNFTQFEFLVPLELFDLLKLAQQEHTEGELEMTEEEVWQSMLYGHVDALKIPMMVELSAMDISLSQLGEMQLGETFAVNATKGGLNILDDTGATAFTAKLEINNRRFGLRVKDAYQKEEA